MVRQNRFSSELKTIGLIQLNQESADLINSETYKPYIKVLYTPKGGKLKVDFKLYDTKHPSLFFISPNQYESRTSKCETLLKL